MTRGVILRPCFRTSLPTTRTLRSLETLQWQTRHGKSGKTLPSAGGSASITSPSRAPLSVVGFYFRTTSKRRSPFLPACTASTSTIRPGACLKSCVSPSQGITLILGMRTHTTRGPTSGFALSLGYRQIRTGGRSWIMDIKVSDLGVPSWLHLEHIDMACGARPIFTPEGCHVSQPWYLRSLDDVRSWQFGGLHAGGCGLNDSIRTYVRAILGA